MLCFLGFIWWRARSAVRTAALDFAAEQNIPYRLLQLPANASNKFEWISAPAEFSAAAEFRGSLYLCGPAGLVEYDSAGVRRKEYRVGRELPPAPLLQMAVAVLADSRQPELLISSAGEGVLAFNGQSFRQIRPEDQDSRAITAILPLASGHLLLGTRKKGLLIYDGKHISPFSPGMARISVTALAGDDADLWVGTLAEGVLHWHAGQLEQFGEDAGLPDRQVLAIAVSQDSAYVGTPLGVAYFDRGRFSRVLARNSFARALLLRGNTLLVGTLDQGIVELRLKQERTPLPQERGSPSAGEIQQFFEAGDKVFALAQQGLYELRPDTFSWRKFLGPEQGLLSDRNVSALAADSSGRLWVGYFDRGLDLLDSDGRKLRHVENEYVFCVNRILPGASRDATAVATANGLVLFDRLGGQQQVLKRADGLIADHITDIAPYRGGMAIATPAGLTFLDAGGARSLYAFHGLVNNHVYALASSGDHLLAGTLGGLSFLDQGQILANYTTANSALKHNWITAVAPLGNEWLVGTYGAGIVRLDSSGQVHNFDLASGKFEVNPNAMIVTDKHVFAGTLGRGLYVYDRESERWKILRDGLPSANVTALAVKQGYLYVGTDNGLVRIREQEVDQ